MKHFSDAAGGLLGQPMFQLLTRVKELEAQGKSITRFEIGDSALGVPPHVIEATKKALDEQKTHYVQSQGVPELREAICDLTSKTHGFRPSIDQVMIMPANGIIDAVVRCVANAKEEVLLPDPGFPTYGAVLNYTGITGVPYKQYEGKERMYIDPKEIESLVSPSTRLIILNSPNNPTGFVATEEEVREVYAIAEKNDTYLLSDEVYSKTIYDGKHYSPAVFDECKERTIILNSFSKAYAMSGWRLGYAIGPVDLIQKMTLLFETIYSCVPPFVQYGGIAALNEHPEYFENYWKLLEESRNLLVKNLNSLPGVSCLVPAGAIYAFANITKTGLTSQQFATLMLEQASVSLLPGTNFGKNGEGYIRLCYARTKETIQEGYDKMKVIIGDGSIYETI